MKNLYVILNLLVATTPLQTLIGCTYYNASPQPQEARQPQTQTVQLTPTERTPSRHAAPVEHTSVSGIREIISDRESLRPVESNSTPGESTGRPGLQERPVTSNRTSVPQRHQHQTHPKQNLKTASAPICLLLNRSSAHYHALPLPEEEKQALKLICQRNGRNWKETITRPQRNIFTERTF